MIGSIVTTVAAARTEVGVTAPTANFNATADPPRFLTAERSYIS